MVKRKIRRKSRRRSFIQRTFGKKFTYADFILILIIIGFPVYLYFNVQYGFILINQGISEVIKQFGGYVWFGVMGYYILKFIKIQAGK